MGSVLLTGFEAFGDETVNPSERAALALDGCEAVPGCRVRSVILPVTWDRGPARILNELDALPDAAAVVMVGQAGGHAGIAVERVAVNVSNGRDETGRTRKEEPVVPGGPPAYFSTLPLEEIVRALAEDGLPAFISNSAGTYLCNCVFYAVMHRLAAAAGRPDGPAKAPPAGFVHVPFLPEQAVGKRPLPPSMSLPDIERALRVVIRTTLAAART
ncbi:MAG TPA: pyroglutamyl-peptidase I [Clostridiales bacterium]|nr:pyroglutamyl-peptidase I [Clostridiales bacterium]